ncbi:hypothetical protein BH10BAC3_BH10BAC3_11980 [soil metagenome]
MTDQQLIIAKNFEEKEGSISYLKVYKDNEYSNDAVYNVEEYSWPEKKLLRTTTLQNVGASKWIDIEFGPTNFSDKYGKFIDENYPIKVHLP